MTSTSFNVGFDGSSRNSSKVLKPPGGGSSDIFGSVPVEQSPRRRTNYMQSSLFVEPESVNTTPARVKSGEGTTTNGLKEASVANGNGNANESANFNANNENAVASAPAVSAPPPSTATSSPARAATAPQRSRVPPGGFSSGLW